MILLIEPNSKIRKRMCDLLSRERILGVGTYPEIYEMMAKFRNNINIIISNIRTLKEILLRGTLFKLCEKLHLEVPPILAIYRKGDEKVKNEFEKNLKYILIKYDGEDNSFPERYIGAIKELYPAVITELKKANESWLKGDDSPSFEDTRKWLVKEGFVKALEKSEIGQLALNMKSMIPMMKEILREERELSKKEDVIEQDYKKMYFDLREKYNVLITYVKQLIDSSKHK